MALSVGPYVILSVLDWNYVRGQLAKIDTALKDLQIIITQEKKEMAAIDDLTAAVASLTDAITAADAAIQAEIAALTAALAGGDTAAIQAATTAISAASTKLASDTAALKASLPPTP